MEATGLSTTREDIMDTTVSGAIVVGVTGRGRETSALEFAAACARRDDAPVVLVHAFHHTLPAPPPSVLLSHAEVGEVAEAVVREVAEEFGDSSGDSSATWRILLMVNSISRTYAHVPKWCRPTLVKQTLEQVEVHLNQKVS